MTLRPRQLCLLRKPRVPHGRFARPARTAPLLALLFIVTVSPAQAASEEEMFFKGARDVNEGDLKFVALPADRAIHHHHNSITIDEASLADGWVRLEQCHEHLDAVPKAQIVYHADRVRNIEVIESRNIGEAHAEASSVQLRDVSSDARLCIRAETRALSRNGEQSWNLSNGPYMRKFLDGYYPMRVSMNVRLLTDRIRYVEITPEAQAGFRVDPRTDGVSYDTVFEGILRTVIRFDARP